MKIVFMGTPDFAKESLKAVYNDGHEILAVVTNPDRPKGRGMKLMASPVKEFAIEKKLKIYQPEKIRGNLEFLDEVRKLKPDVICVVAYGKILPQEILEIPKLGCINVHGSLLPQYRGAAPIQWAVLNGDKITGVTTMYMNAGMDTGDIILKEETQIGEDETTGELWNRLTEIGANLLVKTLKQIKDGSAPKIPQGIQYTMAPMIDKKMSKIDWKNKTAIEIKNLVRGLNPIMGAYSYLDGKKIKFWKVDVLQDNSSNIPNGTVIKSNCKDGLYIKAKNGIIKVLEIQGENAKKMSVQDFLRGNNIMVGSRFE